VSMIPTTGNVLESARRDAGMDVSQKSGTKSADPELEFEKVINGAGQDKSREIHNLRVALTLAEAGMYVHPCKSCSGKGSKEPYNDRWQDDAAGMTNRLSSGRFRGSTNDPKLVRKMWAKYPGAVPGIPAGLNQLAILDPDTKDGKDGIRKLDEFFGVHNYEPNAEGCVTVPTTNGGAHIYYRATDGIESNAQGDLKALDTDVRAGNGYVIAPGSKMDNGTSYGEADDLLKLVKAVKAKTLPLVPSFVAEAISSGSASVKVDGSARKKFARLLLENHAQRMEDEDLTPSRDRYDLQVVREIDGAFAERMDQPTEDKSDDRFYFIRGFKQAYPGITAEDLLSLMEDHPDVCGDFTGDWKGNGAHTFGYEKFAHDFLRIEARGQTGSGSTGEAFDAVADDDETNEVFSDIDAIVDPREKLEKLRKQIEKFKHCFSEFSSFDLDTEAPLDMPIEDMFARGAVTVLVGAPGAGKTALMVDLGMTQACGLPTWAGKAVKHGLVLYIALEDPSDVKARARAWHKRARRLGLDAKQPAFVAWQESVDLFGTGERATEVEQRICMLAEYYSLELGLPVNQIIVDTIQKSRGRAKENTSDDMGPYMAALDRIARKTGASVVALHHPSGGTDNPRGSTSIVGDCSYILHLVRVGETKRCKLYADLLKFRRILPDFCKFEYELDSEKVGEILNDDRSFRRDQTVAQIGSPKYTGKCVGGSASDFGAVDEEGDDDHAGLAVDLDTPKHKSDAVLTALSQNGGWMQTAEVMQSANISRREQNFEPMALSTTRDKLNALAQAGWVAKTGTGKRTKYRLQAGSA
jgi:hypothetical protein